MFIDYKLRGKAALVTGGSHGIGLAVAKELSRMGCRVAVCSRTKERLKEASSLLNKNSAEHLLIQADVLQPGACDIVMDKIVSHWGELHILVNNVGGGGRWGKENIEETAPTVWQEVFEKNALAAALFTRRAIPLMRTIGWGRVITITSIFGKEGGGMPWFNMAKAAEVALMKSLSRTAYLVRSGITFNSVAPGGIFIEGTGFEEEQKRNPEDFKKLIDRDYPLGRMGSVDEVANVVCFLCSEQASLVNGAQITVDGGQSRAF